MERFYYERPSLKRKDEIIEFLSQIIQAKEVKIYPDNEKESKENNYFNPEKAKREPSKSSRVRRREYMKNKQKIEKS